MVVLSKIYTRTGDDGTTPHALARGAAIHRALPRHGGHLSGRQV